jgi:amino acid transporter
VDLQLAEDPAAPVEKPVTLHRHFGLLQAIALNVTMVVGAGVFLNVPLLLGKLPGPYALLGWLAAGLLMLVDGLIWSELATMFPGSGGSYRYLLEGFGKERWGRLFAFLFIWQFLLSGPLELASGLIAVAQFATVLSPVFQSFNSDQSILIPVWTEEKLQIIVDPSRFACVLLGLFLIFLLYRRVSSLGKMTVVLWIGVLGAIAWILLEGAVHFDGNLAFAMPDSVVDGPNDFRLRLGQSMIFAMYAYLGYYNICYVGDEVRNPGRTLPRAIIGSAVIVAVIFVLMHLALLGTIDWHEVAAAQEAKELADAGKGEPPQGEAAEYCDNLAAAFMRKIHGGWAANLVTALLVWTCLGSAFAGLLGYSRIPYGAARYGHFFAVFRKVHPIHHIPHISLFFVGGLTLCWTFFSLDNVITALITTRILEQFVAQVLVVIVLRRQHPDLPRPFRIWFYPLPCGVALAGWIFMYISARPIFIALGLITMFIGIVAFLIWSKQVRQWPFAVVVNEKASSSS